MEHPARGVATPWLPSVRKAEAEVVTLLHVLVHRGDAAIGSVARHGAHVLTPILQIIVRMCTGTLQASRIRE